MANVSVDEKRLKKYKKRYDKERIANRESCDFRFRESDEDPHIWYFEFTVQDGTYNGQVHIVEIKLVYGSKSEYIYPANPPLCTFVTPIWHPNISIKEGIICLDTLKDKWSPTTRTSSIISAILLLLETPEPSSPLNGSAGKQLIKNDKESYDLSVASTYNREAVPVRILSLFDQ